MRALGLVGAVVGLLMFAVPSFGQSVDSLAAKRVVFLGDSITQGGGYITFTDYFLQRLYPRNTFDIYGLGLASETVSGLSEPGHAGGAFPRPCLSERLARLLERVKPEVVFACYGINDGIYLPLDPERFAAFRKGITELIKQCRAAGVKEITLITPPIYDFTPKEGEFNYDSVMAEYAAWEMTLKEPGVRVIDLHTPMRQARDARTEVFSRDRIHPGDEGHLLMARTILAAFGVKVPDETPAATHADPLYKLVDQKRRLRWSGWMQHVGYTREKTFTPQPLGSTEEEAAKLQEQIDALRQESDARVQADGKGWRLEKAQITDPKRPRVLLIGDSILNGYLKAALTGLKGKAYVDAWVNPYCQSENYNKLLGEVLDQGPYDVVHINTGLHGWQVGRIKEGTFEPLTKGFVEVIRRKLPNAKIIWASSTPVTVKGEPGKLDPEINPVIVEQNRMAAKVMAEMGVPVNDFYALLAGKLELARGDQFHWTAPAYQLLADTLVQSVLQALNPPAEPGRTEPR